MTSLNELTNKNDITTWVLNRINECLFYESKKNYMIKMVLKIQDESKSWDEYKNKIQYFVAFHNIEKISQHNIMIHNNLDHNEISKFIQCYKNKIYESNYINSTENDLINKLSEYELKLKSNLISMDTFYQSVYDLMEQYQIIVP